ncbi:hypothetical protein SEA_SICARIUS2_68 [Arthrobacter phage Sicarius2]|uniref:Uncharacterized protein n=2 Tax=Sicariusvirus TaxID=3425006 RepID=A0A8F3E8J3_9CAUD|nr:hypothetical protein SEA_SICARIUS2_68 [Arthrobacter phage Sicarius2]WNM67310.1 hypothetical protein SEA_WYBORN_67 [Arthrobacter phage Wyborn]
MTGQTTSGAALREYFVGGWLDGQARPFEKNLPPQIVACEPETGELAVYVRQPSFDDETTRYWVLVESPAEMLAMRDFAQKPHADRKFLTVNELRNFMAVIDAMGFPADTPIRAQITWTGHLKQIGLSRDDVASDKHEGES